MKQEVAEEQGEDGQPLEVEAEGQAWEEGQEDDYPDEIEELSD